ncbi:tRNA (uracil-5-)-methyltransferase like A [Dissostichus eleginoides]|uniref:tRNA (Uracil-5-)-methyltransferase like A n=1 Tax=Dissostichus eleginoides TaxID=100907 RepID=A0AAD9B2B9_DISEL|nr:tRNA (uracil-5-)-methyltransferase like A [Dissostichus eleginoides]
MCTDAHTQISALFSKGNYKDSGIHHSLDIWHGSKNLGKKVLTAGQQKGCSILEMWNKDICNHFWYCCKTADHYEDFFISHCPDIVPDPSCKAQDPLLQNVNFHVWKA